MDGFTLLDEADAIEAEQPPRMLGRYELLGKLGTGGMATVYLGRIAGEAGFQRLLAIKVLHPHLASDNGFVKMLLDEARIAARLHHPNVVPIIDLGVQGSTHYVAMEYIEGCSLSALLKKRRNERPARLLVAIILDVLAGLDAAHSLTDDEGKPMNLVHRDVSPQNILIGVDGSARITDFGIARAEARINSTRPGELKGKIAYMSPEQIRSGEIDRRSDVFAAGGLLWSMLTGRRLFQGDNEAATMGNIMSLDIPLPSTVGLKPPAVFDVICLCALQRIPAKRFATAREMEEALRESARQEGMLATHREVAAWVTDAFHEELLARRVAIRSANSGGAGAGRAVTLPGSVPAGTVSTTNEFSKPTSSGEDEAPEDTLHAGVSSSSTKLGETQPLARAQPTAAEGSSLAEPRRKRALIAVGGAAVIVLAVVTWIATRSTDGPRVEPTHTPAEPAELRTPSESVPAPTATSPPSPAPVAEPARGPDVPVSPIETRPTTPARPPPEPARRKPPVSGRIAPTKPPPAPAKPVPPPVTTATVPTPTPIKPPPTKPTTWDKDSPVPPP